MHVHMMMDIRTRGMSHSCNRMGTIDPAAIAAAAVFVDVLDDHEEEVDGDADDNISGVLCNISDFTRYVVPI